MNTLLTPTSPPVASPKSQPASTTGPKQVAAAAPQAPTKTIWTSDHFAMTLWLTGATIVATLLIWDLVVALVRPLIPGGG